MLPDFILNTDEPDDPIVEIRFSDGQNVFYSLEGIPEAEWQFTIAAMRQEAQDKFDKGEPVDAKTYHFRI